MNIFESITSAYENVLANKMRSFLTMLGIIIGIASVLAIVSIGQGYKNYMADQFKSMGTNTLTVQVQSKNNDIQSSDYITLDDCNLMKEKISEISDVVPTVRGMSEIKLDKISKRASVTGITEAYKQMLSEEILKGRFINKHDVDSLKNYAVIDDMTANTLFHTTNVIGKQVKLQINDNTLNVVIIGIIENPYKDMQGPMRDNIPGDVYIPITIADQIIQNTKIGSMSVVLKSMNNYTEVSQKIERFLENRHRTSGKYTVNQAFSRLDTIDKVLSTFTLIIGSIAGISLLVGGIGVMNIMLVSVTERTREIGIRMSIGAKPRDIRIQFLTESVIICFMGGGLGILLGIALGKVAAKFIQIDPVVSIGVICIAFVFSSAVGIFFGIYPANKAAKLDPIEALRYE